MLHYWSFIKKDEQELSELADLALRFLHICPHAAGIERVWSLMGNIQRKGRNRLLSEKVHSAAVLKMDIYHNRPKVSCSKDKCTSSSQVTDGIPEFSTPDADEALAEYFTEDSEIADLISEINALKDDLDVHSDDDELDNEDLSLQKVFGVEIDD